MYEWKERDGGVVISPVHGDVCGLVQRMYLLDFARVRRCLWFRPCTEMFAGRSNECTYIGDSESCCVGRNISVSFCRIGVVLFNLWTSSCSTIIIKIVFLADTCSDSDFDFWILIWFWNLSLAPAQNIYLFILKILFSLDQNISSWLFCFCFLFII